MKDSIYLATTGITDVWDLDARLIVLGPWCLLSRQAKDLIKNREYFTVSSPWQPYFYKIQKAADYSFKTYELLLPKLASSLNEIHGVSYPLASWRVLIGPWLLHFIGFLYDRYKHLERALELFPELYTTVLPSSEKSLLSYDTYDFLSGKINEHYYNLKAFSVIASYLCPGNIKQKEYMQEDKVHKFNYSLKSKAVNNFLIFSSRFFKSKVILSDMYQVSYLDICRLRIAAGFWCIGHLEFNPPKVSGIMPYSVNLRTRIKLEGASDNFEQLLFRLIPLALPACYAESYDFYRDTVKNINALNSLKAVGSSVGWFFNERFKFFAAEAALRGARLIDFQHGGQYGFSLVLANEKLALEKNIFYTWGWGLKGNNTIRALPSPHLSRLKDVYLPKKNNILFISSSCITYHFRLDSDVFPEDMPKYFEDKEIFFKIVENNIKKIFLYRLYPHEYGWSEEEVVRAFYPDIKFIRNKRLAGWMKKARLVVIDHPRTSFLEALNINVPCILYWDHDVYLMRPEAEGYFELLRKAGILYKNPKSAAEKVNEIYDNSVEWWLSDEIQKVRKDFCEYYAFASKDWLRSWAEELKR